VVSAVAFGRGMKVSASEAKARLRKVDGTFIVLLLCLGKEVTHWTIKVRPQPWVSHSGALADPFNANNLYVNMNAILGYRIDHAKNYLRFLSPYFCNTLSKLPANLAKNIKQK
jgi:hypothetical protein